MVKGHDPAAEKREEKRTAQSSLSTLLAGDGPYERDLQARHMVNQRPILSALRRGLAKLMVRDVASLTRQVGDALMMRPGDQSLVAGPEEVIACRCSVLYQTETRQADSDSRVTQSAQQQARLGARPVI